MGIGPSAFLQLVELSRRFRPEGRSLMLGRQRFRAGRRRSKDWLFGNAAANILKRHRPELTPDQVRQPDGYAETMFRTLGFGEVEALDYSEFEGASLLWDLNRPVPEDWHGQFGFVFDGGTLEHVFDVPQALRNVFDLLAPGGRFVSANPLTGWVGHGLYQFNPELVWSFWARACGCTVHRCLAMNDSGRFRHDFADTDGKRREVETRWHGLRGSIPPGRIFLWSEVEKTDSARIAGPALQGDYVARWAGGARATSRLTATSGAIAPAAMGSPA